MRSPILIFLFLIAAAAAARVMLSKQGEREQREAEAPGALGASKPSSSAIGRFPRSQFFIEHDRFLPATDPKVMAGTEARFLKPTDEVYGFVLAGHSRAYPVRMIAYHHVVNDQIHGIPVAVTY